MPVARFQLEDGRIARFEVPDGTTPEQAQAMIAEHLDQVPKAPDPTEGMSRGEKFAAGAGKMAVDLYRGAKQSTLESQKQKLDMVRQFAANHPGPSVDPAMAQAMGLGSDPLGQAQQNVAQQLQGVNQDIAESRKLDAPLMNSGWGKAGYIAGGVGAASPVMLIPGVNSAVGAAVTGGLFGNYQPTMAGESRTKNTLVSGGLGMLGQQVGGRVVPWLYNKAQGSITNATTQKAVNATRDATLAEGRNAGYVVPPSEVKPGLVSNLLERWAGKASVGQKASLNNQQVTNRLVRETLGLPKDAPITPETLQPVKQAAWSVYDQVKGVGQIKADKPYMDALTSIKDKFNGLANEFPELGNAKIDNLVTGLQKDQMSSNGIVEAIRKLRADASTNLSPMNMDPAAKALGKAQSGAADALESLVERNLQSTAPNLVKDFQNARVTLGKVGTVERALNESTGDVSARKLAGQLAKGKPISGDMKTAAKFAQAFPRYVQENVNAVPGGSPLDMMAGIGTSAATGNPAWMGLSLGRPLARSAVLSGPFARPPSYSSIIPRAAIPLLAPFNNNVAQTGLGLLGPSIYATQR